MNSYRYEGISNSGTRVKGVVEAYDEAEAIAKAKQSCRVVSSVSLIGADANSILNFDIGAFLSGGKIKSKKLSLLCSQLAIELKAGLSLVRSLQLVAENEEDKTLQKTLKQVADDVHSGHGLADSFKLRGPGFPNTFIETVRAGEESGRLDESFAKLKVYYENSAAVSSKVASAMIYPIMLILVAIAVIVIVMVKAVPTFTKAFADLGSALPWPTKALISMSNFFVKYWVILLVVVAAIALFLNLFGKTETGKKFYARLLLTFPGINMVNRMSAAANFCSTMGTMLSSGLPLVQALDITSDVTQNTLISQDIKKTQRGVIEGRRMGDGLKESEWLPSLLIEMAAVGEETGNLEETLEVVNEYYTKEVDVAVNNAMKILEPVITIVLALIVVFILLSVYLPLFSMYGSVG